MWLSTFSNANPQVVHYYSGYIRSHLVAIKDELLELAVASVLISCFSVNFWKAVLEIRLPAFLQFIIHALSRPYLRHFQAKGVLYNKWCSFLLCFTHL